MATVAEGTGAVSSSLAAFGDALPQALEGAETYASRGSEALEQRKEAALILGQAPALVELLDAPGLMGHLVRKRAYDDALALREFVLKAHKRLRGIGMVAHLVAQVEDHTARMVADIRDALARDVKVPACISSLSYLKRLGLFSPRALRLLFLAARQAHLEASLAAVAPGEAGAYALGILNAYRVTTLHVITQYSAVFADDTAPETGRARAAASRPIPLGKDSTSADSTSAEAAAAAPSSPSSAASADAGSVALVGDVAPPACGLLYSWVHGVVNSLIDFLADCLPRVDSGAALKAILGKANSFGASLARTGVDFRPLLPPLFTRAATALLSSRLEAGGSQLLSLLESYNWEEDPFVLASAKRTELSLSPFVGPFSPFAPPETLLSSPLLAILCNAYIRALNELRECAPLASGPKLASVYADALVAIGSSLVTYANTTALVSPAAFDFTRNMGSAVLVPYLLAAFDHVYNAKISFFSKERVASIQTSFQRS